MRARSVSVVVPATSANLGCAFDCAGIALDLYLRAQATVSDGPGLAVSCRGVDASQIPQNDSNLVVQAMQRAAARAGKSLPGMNPNTPPGLKVELENEIPLGVGLGSSAAAIITGTLLGAELAGVKLEAADLLRMALEMEGHPDNLAAAIHGGMVVAAVGEESAEPLIARIEVSPALDFVAVIPEAPLPTAKARAALPASYSRQDAVFNLQRTAVLVARFFSGQPLSPELFRDRLHQPYRSPLVPGIAECLEYRHEGLAGIFLSGAGSAVMAIVERGDGQRKEKIAEDLIGEFRRRSTAARALFLKADNRGTQVTGPFTGTSGPRSFPVPIPSRW